MKTQHNVLSWYIQETMFKPIVTRLQAERVGILFMDVLLKCVQISTSISKLSCKLVLLSQWMLLTCLSFGLRTDMYTSVVDEGQKDGIIQRFTNDSHLRIVIAMIAFGMGHLPDVRQVMHVGLPDDIESYI